MTYASIIYRITCAATDQKCKVSQTVSCFESKLDFKSSFPIGSYVFSKNSVNNTDPIQGTKVQTF